MLAGAGSSFTLLRGYPFRGENRDEIGSRRIAIGKDDDRVPAAQEMEQCPVHARCPAIVTDEAAASR